MIGQAGGVREGGGEFGRSGRARVEDQVGAAGLLQRLLQARQREVHGGRRQLRRLQSETAVSIVPDHCRDAAAEAFEGRLGAGDGRVAGDDPGFGKADHEGVAHLQAEARGEGQVDRHRIRSGGGRRGRPRGEGPELLGDAEDLDLPRAGLAAGVDGGALGEQDRRAPAPGGGRQLRGEFGAEKAIARGDDLRGLSRSLFRRAGERGAHGGAGKKGAEEHRGPQHRPRKDPQGRVAVVNEAAGEVARGGHRGFSPPGGPVPAGRCGGGGGRDPGCG